MLTINEILAQELGQKQEYVDNVVQLIDEGNTIPFIARYRKALKEFELIEDGDRVLIGLSGGKDSLFLVEMLGRQRLHRGDDHLGCVTDKDVADGGSHHLHADGSAANARSLSPTRPAVALAVAADEVVRIAKTCVIHVARGKRPWHKLRLGSDAGTGGKRCHHA